MKVKEHLFTETHLRVQECRGNWLFADGGLLTGNPSEVGGVWAWCQVRDNQRIEGGAGIVVPHMVGLPVITSPLSEMLAAIHGMEALPAGWSGTMCLDSLGTLYRLFGKPGAPAGAVPWENVPDDIRERAFRAKSRLGTLTSQHIDGHPKPPHFRTGIGKRGGPISIHNKWCDDEANAQKKLYAKRLASPLGRCILCGVVTRAYTDRAERPHCCCDGVQRMKDGRQYDPDQDDHYIPHNPLGRGYGHMPGPLAKSHV